MRRAIRPLALTVLLLITPTGVMGQTPPFDLTAALATASAAGARVRLAQQVSCDESRARGRTDAGARHRASGWFLGGVGAGVGLGFISTFVITEATVGDGLVLGLIGEGVITAASAIWNPQPRPPLPSDVEEPCYRDGYSGRAKNRNVVLALLGGLVGTAAWVAISVAKIADR